MKIPRANFNYPSRPERKRGVLIWFGIGLLVWLAMLWAPGFPKSLIPGIRTRKFGMFEYLYIRNVSPSLPAPLYAHLDTVQWNWLALTVTIILTIAPTIVLIRLAWFHTLPRYSKRFCDECGYDLKPSQSISCPECGHAQPDLAKSNRGDSN